MINIIIKVIDIMASEHSNYATDAPSSEISMAKLYSAQNE